MYVDMCRQRAVCQCLCILCSSYALTCLFQIFRSSFCFVSALPESGHVIPLHIASADNVVDLGMTQACLETSVVVHPCPCWLVSSIGDVHVFFSCLWEVSKSGPTDLRSRGGASQDRECLWDTNFQWLFRLSWLKSVCHGREHNEQPHQRRRESRDRAFLLVGGRGLFCQTLAQAQSIWIHHVWHNSRLPTIARTRFYCPVFR